MKRQCTIQDCSKDHYAHGYCTKHHYRWKTHGDPSVTKKPRNKKCSIEHCKEKHCAKGYCREHYSRYRLSGDPLYEPSFKGYYINKDGYKLVHIPDWLKQYYSNDNKFMFEHRLVMSEYLGRQLEDYETVHHKNGIRDDNRLSNLELWSSRHPKGQKVEDLIEFAEEILELYKK